MIKVADVASIRNGYAFRGRIESEKDGDTRVIQASDLAVSNELNAGDLACVQLGKKAERYKVVDGDLLFVARGSRLRVFRPRFTKKVDTPVVTASGLLVIRPKPKKVLSEYLYWLFGTHEVKHQIQVYSVGQTIPFISDKSVGDIKVSVPPISAQKKIAKLLELDERRSEIRQKIAAFDKQIMKVALASLSAGEIK